MRCLVTGHKGFVGTKLTNFLKEKGCHVTGVDLKEGENILEILPEDSYDLVFHLAALPRVEYSVNNPSYTLKNNVLGTSKVLEWASKHGVKRFIFSSSSAIYGDGAGPISPYGLHKRMSEMECELYSNLFGLETVSLRYFNIFAEEQEYGGAYSTIICAWKEMIRRQEPLRIDGTGDQRRDYIHVDDVCKANWFFATCDEVKLAGETYDIGTGESISVNQIKEIVDKYHDVTWNYASPRVGDPFETKANTTYTKQLGWEAQGNPIELIEECFKKIKEN